MKEAKKQMKGYNGLEMPDAVPVDVNTINFSRVVQTFRPGSYTLEDLPEQLPVINKKTGRFRVFSKSTQRSKRVVSMSMLSGDDTDVSTESWPESMPERKNVRVVSMFQNGTNRHTQGEFSSSPPKDYKEKELPPPPPIEKGDMVANVSKRKIASFYNDLVSLNSVDSDLFRSGESLKLKIFEEYFYESPSSLPSSIYFTDNQSLQSNKPTESSVDDFDSTTEYLRKSRIGKGIDNNHITNHNLFSFESIQPPTSYMPIKNDKTSYTESLNTEITRRNSLTSFGASSQRKGRKPYIQSQQKNEFYLDTGRNYNYSRYVAPPKYDKKRIVSAFY